jgi:hypothetical protein
LTFAQDTHKQGVNLDSVFVKSYRNTSGVKIKPDGTIHWKMNMLDDLPKIMGNADPIHYAQMLPGIQTNSEYQSGIHVQGFESAHSLVSIGGVPIYNVNHLLGFFSSFNASHYSSMEIDNSGHDAKSSNRLGGTLNVEPGASLVDSLQGEASVGLISSQGTLHIPLGKNTSAALSLRGSYINLLYDRWLSLEEANVQYAFYDANVSINHQVDADNQLLLDCYGGSDAGSFIEPYYQSNMTAHWGNYMGALHWIHTNDLLRFKSTLYSTNYFNHVSIKMDAFESILPSGIYDWGYKGNVEYKNWNLESEVIYHDIYPQSLKSTETYNTAPSDFFRQQSVEATASCAYFQPIQTLFSIHLGLKLPMYFTSDKTFWNLDPVCSLNFEKNATQVSLSYALKHQYLFQTGFTNTGLPTEFWLSANKDNLPQYSHGLQMSASNNLFHGMFRLNAAIFYTRLFNQIEYHGNVLDLINNTYNLQRLLLHGDGTNYGFSIMLQKIAGKMTGWCSYTNTHARRRFVEMGKASEFPASHERPHELNAVLSYSPSKHWTIGATVVYASGTPFTAPISLSLINGNILSMYGQHNANRLRPYFRMDTSVNYKWNGKSIREQGVNLSLYNTTSHQNDLFWRIKTKNIGAFAYQPTSFMLDMLPSISYFCKF